MLAKAVLIFAQFFFRENDINMLNTDILVASVMNAYKMKEDFNCI
jgi:hypothetical protein